jgi:CRP-like cAMP-binding protein
MLRRTNHLHNLLAHLPLFQSLSQPHLEIIAGAARDVRVAKGEMLFQRGDPARSLLILVTGCVKLALPSQQGLERVIAMVKPGEGFGMAVFFMEGDYPVYAQAVEDSYLVEIPKAQLFEVMDADPKLSRFVIAGLCQRLQQLVADIENCTFRGSAQRVICYLGRHQPDEEASQYEITLPASKQDVASHLNLAPETFSRVLHQLSEEKLIRVKGRVITVLDAKAMQRFEAAPGVRGQ